MDPGDVLFGLPRISIFQYVQYSSIYKENGVL